ncbi:MAG: hypothetical protein QOJ29_3063, partial [Thermoleophilaceae bacterium]|nr:hypothetical protein [Thermoleophilaceae bacterium]
MPRASVVVATRDRADSLAALLSALAEQTLPREDFEVIVIDDGSTDHTARVLAEAEARGTLQLRIARDEGRGPGAARNRGWREARGEIVAFTDDDCRP